jgi:WD40 repeat protein
MDPPLVQILGGHDTIYTIAILPDKSIAVGSGSSIEIWTIDGKQIQTLNGHDSDIRCMVTTKTKLISGANDDTIIIWNLDDFSTHARLRGHTDRVISLAILTDTTLVSGDLNSNIIVWNMTTGEQIRRLVGLNYSNSGTISIVPIGNDCVISTSYNGCINMWNLNDGTCIKSIDHYAPQSFDRLSKNLFISKEYECLTIRNKQLETVEKIHLEDGVRCYRLLTIDNRYVVWCSRGGEVTILDIETKTVLKKFKACDHAYEDTIYYTLQFFDDRYLIVGNIHDDVYIYDVSNWISCIPRIVSQSKQLDEKLIEI